MTAHFAIIDTTVRTLDPIRPFSDAIAWSGGMVVAIGESEVRRAVDATTEVIDGAGRTVTPGLVDGHQHLFMGAERARGVDMTGVRELDEFRARVRAGRAGLRPDEWLLGFGAEYAPFHAVAYHYELLDGADGPGPMLLWSFDLHSAFVNEAALRIAGVDGARRFADASAVVCDGSGRPTGELREWLAMNLVGDAIPAPSAETLRSWHVGALSAQNAVGITGQHLMDGDRATVGLLAALEDDGALTQRVRMHHFIYASTDDDEITEIIESSGRSGRLWRADGAKFMMDGVIDTGTGWLERPDALGQNTEPLWPDTAKYAGRVQTLHDGGLRIATHAIGDRAVRNVLDVYAGLSGGSAGRHRIEHIETAPDPIVARFGPEGVTASMQPVAMQWVEPDGSDPWSARLDKQRCDHGWRVGDLSAGGATVVLGSDWPVAHFDPRLGFYCARLRRGPEARDERPVGATRALTGEETLAGYTINAARAVGAHTHAGMLRAGFDADLVMWAGDPVTCPPADVLALPVELTVVAGRIVHRA
jgi:predicted amidohydrolase YtcJ